MLIFNLEKDVINLSIHAEISKALNISQCGKANHDSIFLPAAKSQLMKSVCVQSKKGLKICNYFLYQ